MAGPSLIAARALLFAVAVAPVTDAAVRAEVDRLVPAVAAARSLPFRGTLPARTMTRTDARAAIEAALGAGAAERGLGREAELLRRLGLIPAGADYGALLLRSYAPAAAPAPFYDVSTKRLLVPDFVPLADQRLLLAHEIAHAVADQRFGLRRELGLAADGSRLYDGDAQRARAALIEGDATLAALATIDPRETFLGASALGTLVERMRAAPTPGLPRWLAELSRFVHVDGFLAVARVRARQPWSAVDAMWADPPASTEQVLHPEAYDACDNPIPISEDAFPSLPGFGRPVGSDVLGELVVRTWLAAAVPAERAARAAAGWGGDRAALYGASSTAPDAGVTPDPPLLWLTIWDDAAEAADFAQAAALAMAHQGHLPPPDGASDLLQNPRTGSGPPAMRSDEQSSPSRDANRIVFATAPGINNALIRRADAVALLFGVPDLALGAAERLAESFAGDGAAKSKRPRGDRPRRAAPAGCPRRDRAAAPR